jgi:predicted secreted protein
MSNAIRGKGTTIGYSDTAEGEPTLIAEVLAIPFPGKTAGDIDVTNMDSDGDYQEFIAGMISTEQLKLELNYESDQQDALEDAFRDQLYWTITFPDGATYTFEGYINQIGGNSPHDNKITATIGIKITGPATFTPAAS